MTTPGERWWAVKRARALMHDLTTQGNVPAWIRNDAKGILRHYPTDLETDEAERLAKEEP